jgi:hypothetical protein
MDACGALRERKLEHLDLADPLGRSRRTSLDAEILHGMVNEAVDVA